MTWFNRTLSLLVAIGYVVYSYESGAVATASPGDIFGVVVALTMVLCTIWFGSDIANFGLGQEGPSGEADEATPGPMISLLGWILLLSPLLIIPLLKSIEPK